jgi:hypothetical protein
LLQNGYKKNRFIVLQLKHFWGPSLVTAKVLQASELSAECCLSGFQQCSLLIALAKDLIH